MRRRRNGGKNAARIKSEKNPTRTQTHTIDKRCIEVRFYAFLMSMAFTYEGDKTINRNVFFVQGKPSLNGRQSNFSS